MSPDLNSLLFSCVSSLSVANYFWSIWKQPVVWVWIHAFTMLNYLFCSCVYVYPAWAIALYLVNNTEDTTWGKEWVILYKSRIMALEEITSLTPTDPILPR